jgi:hypothetical protein
MKPFSKYPKFLRPNFLCFFGVELNEFETDPYFLQFFHSNTTVCLIIHMFCKSYEPEIVFVLICNQAEQFHVHKSHKMRESCIGNFEENIYLSRIYSAVFLAELWAR